MPIIKSSKIHKNILVFSLLVLFFTTVYWSLLGSIVHNNNADQLIDPLLFKDIHTFNEAVFPSAHTFLIKWPLFALIALSGHIVSTTILITVLLCLATVAGLFYLIQTIEKRALVLALYALFLSSVLLMVPVEPRPGALLPTNFAMLTTRNIEYVVFAYGIILALKMTRYHGIVSILILTILFASDRLFMMLGLGAIILSLVLSWLSGRKHMLGSLWRLFIIVTLATVLNYALLTIISLSGLTNISADGTSPYQLAFDIKEKVEATIYALLGAATNLGANPIYSVVSWREILPSLTHQLSTWTSVAYAINAAGVIFLLFQATKLLKIKMGRKSNAKNTAEKQNALLLSLFFLSSGIVSIAMFIVATHYYPVDARYLAIWLVVAIILASTCSLLLWKRPSVPVYVWALLSLSIAGGILSTYNQYQTSLEAYDQTRKSNIKISEALKQHPVNSLVGDYWRTVPISAGTNARTNILPLESCRIPRSVLTSNAWLRSSGNQSFAYLLTTHQTGTGYPPCSFKDIQEAYGVPSNQIVISGELPNPNEVLLFYDYGIHKKSIQKSEPLIRSIDSLDSTQCPKKTIMQIVAHPDDDLLFMNPDLANSLLSGDCIRTIYLTAGDNGFQKSYWIGREDGAKAAYATGLSVTNPRWKSDLYQLPSKRINLSISQLREAHGRVSLLFLRLPDGNIQGNGFESNKKESLRSLDAGAFFQLHSVDGQSRYTKDDLVNTLVLLMKKYRPSEIRTHISDHQNTRYPDHSDHEHTSKLVLEAHKQHNAISPGSSVIQYGGYSIKDYPSNVAERDLETKKRMFYAYGKHDKAVCTSDDDCLNTSYHWYLPRQYNYR